MHLSSLSLSHTLSLSPSCPPLIFVSSPSFPPWYICWRLVNISHVCVHTHVWTISHTCTSLRSKAFSSLRLETCNYICTQKLRAHTNHLSLCVIFIVTLHQSNRRQIAMIPFCLEMHTLLSLFKNLHFVGLLDRQCLNKNYSTLCRLVSSLMCPK